MSTATIARPGRRRITRTREQAELICRLAERHRGLVQEIARGLRVSQAMLEDMIEFGMGLVYELADNFVENERIHAKQRTSFVDLAKPVIEDGLRKYKKEQDKERRQAEPPAEQLKGKVPPILSPLSDEQRAEIRAFTKQHGGIEALIRVLQTEKIGLGRITVIRSQLAHYLAVTSNTVGIYFTNAELSGRIRVQRQGHIITDIEIIEAT